MAAYCRAALFQVDRRSGAFRVRVSTFQRAVPINIKSWLPDRNRDSIRVSLEPSMT
jgi:hypothetical protein